MARIDELARLMESDELTQTTLADRTGIILDIERLQVFSLNETAIFLLECLKAGVQTEEELASRLVDEFETDLERAERDVSTFIDELVAMLRQRDAGDG